MKVYQKINTMYKRYMFDTKTCPNPKWNVMKNKIVIGDFSDKDCEYLFKTLWHTTSKIDGTNSKIAYYPSTGEIKVGGKSDNAQSQQGQFEYLEALGNELLPKLQEMFPKESAVFSIVKEQKKTLFFDATGSTYTPDCEGYHTVKLEEDPIYIYGEYFGSGVQKCGRRYIENGHDFLVFDIWKQGYYLPMEELNEMCEKLGLKQVPYIGEMTLSDIEEMVMNGFTTKLEGASDPTLVEEGIVARPVNPLLDSRGNRIITKVKTCDYIDYTNARSQLTNEEFKEFSEWYEEHKLQ